MLFGFVLVFVKWSESLKFCKMLLKLKNLTFLFFSLVFLKLLKVDMLSFYMSLHSERSV